MRTSHLTRILTLVLLSLMACLALSATTLAQNIAYSVNGVNTFLYSINLSTGATTPIGPTFSFFITGLSFGPDGRLYGVDAFTDQLVTINTTHGTAAVVGNLDVDVNFGGLTFDLQGRLFFADEGGLFLQINPATGQATLLGNTGQRITSLATSPSGVLYGFDNNDNLYTINPANGAAMLVGSLGFDVNGGGLDFAPNGTLYGVSALFTPSLFTVNPQTGQATIISPLEIGFNSLAIPQPIAPFAVMNPRVSDQKAGSVLVFPYYNSSPTGTTADTLIQISNVCNGTSVSGGVPNYSYLHLFFMKGCSPADTYACLTPNGSLNILASVYDPGVEGYLIAVAVDANGVPVQNNCFIGSAYVRDDNTGFADSYGAESFWKNTPGSVAVTSGYAAINLNGTDYDAAPTQFSVQVQDPAIADEYVVLASVSGNLGSSLASVSQSGFGIVYRADETPASFQPQLNSGCLSITLIDAGKIRVATQNGGYNNFLKDSYGYLKFNVTSPAVGLLISRQGAAGQPINRFSGIRTLHKTQVGSATLSMPVFPPFCF